MSGAHPGQPRRCSTNRLTLFEEAAKDVLVCWPPAHRLPTPQELLWLVSEARDAQAMREDRAKLTTRSDELWHGNDAENLEDALHSIEAFQGGEGATWEIVEHVFVLTKPLLERELEEVRAREDLPAEELHSVPQPENDPGEELPF